MRQHHGSDTSSCAQYMTGMMEYEHAGDIFSFGVLLAEIWSGKLQNHRPSQKSKQKYNFYSEYIKRAKDVKLDKDTAITCATQEEEENMKDATEVYVDDESDIYDMISLAHSNRHIGHTKMNEGSSRSHLIFLL